MIDHVSLKVASVAASKAFYTRVLATLGYELFEEHPKSAGFGPPGKPVFFVGESDDPSTGVHVGFVAANRAEVNAFYTEALAAGGTDFGAPGLRPNYHPNYYGAFVLDPDGNNVEAVCHLAD